MNFLEGTLVNCIYIKHVRIVRYIGKENGNVKWGRIDFKKQANNKQARDGPLWNQGMVTVNPTKRNLLLSILALNSGI